MPRLAGSRWSRGSALPPTTRGAASSFALLAYTLLACTAAGGRYIDGPGRVQEGAASDRVGAIPADGRSGLARGDLHPAFPRKGADLKEVLAGLRRPAPAGMQLTVNTLEVLKIDTEPWASIELAGLETGAVQPVPDESYVVIMQSTCRPSGAYRVERLSWYLLPNNSLRAWEHDTWPEGSACIPRLSLEYSRGKLAEAERTLRDRMDRSYPKEHETAIEAYLEGIALVRAGRLDEARASLARGDELPRLAKAYPSLAASVGFDDRYTEDTRSWLLETLAVQHGEGSGTDQGGSAKSSAPRFANQSSLAQMVMFDRMQARLPLLGEMEEAARSGSSSSPAEQASLMVESARLALYRGQAEQAEALHTEALAIRQQELGATHLDVARSLAGLAETQCAQRRATDADRAIHSAWAILRASPKADPWLAHDLRVLESQIAMIRGQTAEAVEVLRDLLGESRRLWGHAIGSAIVLPRLAAAETAAGRLGDARSHLDAALEHAAPYLRDVDLARVFGLQAYLASRAGRASDAIAYQQRANSAFDAGRVFSFLAQGEQERRHAAEQLAPNTWMTFDLALELQIESGYALAMSAALSRKGLVLDASRADRVELERLRNPEIANTVKRLRTAQARLAEFGLSGASDTDPGAYRAQETEVQTLLDQLRDAIAAEDHHEPTSGTALLNQVRDMLPPGSMLADYVVYRPFEDERPSQGSFFDNWGDPRYAVCVLGRMMPVSCEDLGPVSTIDSLVTAFRDALRDPVKSDARSLGRTLDQVVMRPVRERSRGETLVIVSPDGALNLIPFAALVDEDGDFLIRRLTITYVTTGRDIVASKRPNEPHGRAVVVGDPAFGELPIAGAGPERRKEGRTGHLLGNSFPRLPGTRREALAVGEILQGSRILLGEDATEAAVKSLTSPRILHLATHGFFLPGVSVQDVSGRSAYANVHVYERGDPLVRSGLALAGANQRERGGEGGEDGLLTALELSGLDFSGTRLLVLSACETGLGDVDVGEGVYGLRRAVVLSGAESQVTTLWKVDDAVTETLMGLFYQRLVHGETLEGALRAVQVEMLDGTRAKHPYYWASFIPIGRPGPIY